jgi:hypothetical protein
MAKRDRELLSFMIFGQFIEVSKRDNVKCREKEI